jgi:hypothetical protein
LALDVGEGHGKYRDFTALLGFAVSILFGLRTLLLVVVVLAPVSIVFALARDFSVLGLATLIMVAQTIVQASYFLGLVTRNTFGKVYDARRPFP